MQETASKTREPQLDGILDVLQAEGVLGAYLFGSRARGRAHSNSDWDVAVLFPRQAPKDAALDLKRRLEVHLGMPVDVIDLRSAPLELTFTVLSGKALITSPAAAEWEIQAMSRFWDFSVFERHLPPYTEESRERRRRFHQEALERALRALG
jgi:uncharacterized protein